jgi:hypothetical protein
MFLRFRRALQKVTPYWWWSDLTYHGTVREWISENAFLVPRPSPKRLTPEEHTVAAAKYLGEWKESGVEEVRVLSEFYNARESFTTGGIHYFEIWYWNEWLVEQILVAKCLAEEWDRVQKEVGGR